MKLAAADAQLIQTIDEASGSPLRVDCLLRAQSSLSVAITGEELQLSLPTVTFALKHLSQPEIVRETTKPNCVRIYAYDKYLKIINEGTEPSD
jgi:hypothetical protein